jgi:hypothetical protein
MAAEAGVMGGSRSERALERLKTTAGVLAAVAGAITGLWTVYDKVKTDARQYTAASYETLAPQMNQMAEALRKLEQDNQQLKQALVVSRSTERARAPARPRTATPAAKPAEPSSSPPTAGAPATAPAQAGEQPADDALGKILGTVHQTREAVEAVRKVPETFQKVLDQKGKK